MTSEEAAAVLAGTTAALTAGVEAAGVEAAGAEAALEGAAGFAGASAALVAAVVEPEDEEAAVEAADALVDDPFCAESSELQPPRTAMNEMHANPAQTLSAPTLNTIVTRSYCCVMRGTQATMYKTRVHAGSVSLPSVTPLSAACRPEALRPRLATGLPLNDG